LHCEGIIRLYKEFCREQWGNNIPTALAQRIREICEHIVNLEAAFIDQAFELGGVKGMEPQDIKRYTAFVGDWRLDQLGLQPVFGVKDHPLPWLIPLLNGVEHTNFFEGRATEYSKAATKGEWNDVWRSFDAR
jgi:ribonucleoside-diphosphate reductase beta chain